MNTEVDLLQKSQRLRYEAFSNFAAEVSQATSEERMAQLLATHLKFILDCFMVRIFYEYEQNTFVFRVFRGVSTWQENPDDPFVDFERACLAEGLPLQLSRENFVTYAALEISEFAHPKIVSFHALPTTLGPDHRIICSVGNKEYAYFSEVDFRFLKLISNLLANKLSQLLLLKRIEKKNQELERANQSLVVLNTEVQHLNGNLERMVEQRTHELRKTNEELNTIFYRSSHDFRRPLTTILGLANLAEMETSESGRLHLLQLCKNVVFEMDSMLGKLGVLSGFGNHTHAAVALNFEEMYQRLQQKFANKLHEQDVTFSLRNTLRRPCISDPEIVTAIIDNLVENAINFNGKGGRVKLKVYERANRVYCSVIDNGVGIDSTARLFEMYYKGHSFSKGNGLGLYVVKKLTELLQAEIHALSKPGLGSVFTVVLPQKA